MKRIFVLLNMCILLSIGSLYAETKYCYAKVTATDGTVQWLKLDYDNSYMELRAFTTNTQIQGTLDLDEIYTETGGNGTKITFSKIGNNAFSNFGGLTAVKGTSVKTLGSWAFYCCTSLNSIDFPYLKEIGASSFGYCTSLKSYMIPASVESIDGTAFIGCTNLTLSVSSNSYYFSCENRILYSKYKTTIYAFLSSRTDTEYIVPSTVKTIGEWAFYENKYLKSIVLSNGVETIMYSAFNGSKIQSIFIPQSVTSISPYVFSNCNSLTSVKVANPTPIALSREIFSSTNTITLYVPQGSKETYESANYWKDASSIVEYAPSPNIQFADANVKSVCVANWDYDGDGELSEAEAQEIWEIGTQFKGNTAITSFNELQYFTNLRTIGTTAFSGCTNLASFTVPASLTKIGQNAFQNTAWLNAQPDGLVYIGNVLYTYKGTMPENTKIVVKDGTTCICNYAFSNQTNLIEIELPNSLLYLGTEDTSLEEYGYVFNYCTGLTTIKIPAGVKDIIRYTFRGSGLKTVELPEGLESIGNSSFRSCSSLESIVIPDKVRTIGKNTFRDCKKLQQVTMSSSLMIVYSDAFRDCNQLQRVDISNLGGWCNVDFIDYRANPLTYAHHLYLNGKEVVEFETTSDYNIYGNTYTTWKEIKPRVFYGCQGIKTVSIGKNITSIGIDAFYNCTGLKSVKTEAEPFTLSTSAFPTRANVSLYTTQGYLNQYQQTAVWSEFKAVKSYPNLDVNEDGEVDVLDVVDIVNYTKGLSTSDTFVHFLADFNNDKKVTKADAERVAQAIPTTGRFNELPATEGVTDIVLADNIQIRTGETNTASIQLQNTTDGLVGFQMDITLPEGVSLIEKDCRLSNRIADTEQNLQIGKLSDNTYRLTATSLALQSLTGNDGELINITLKATELSDGGAVNIKNIRIVTNNSERLVLADAAFGIQIVDVTPAIAFQDDKVKAICVTNWDVNGDGELSTREAAKVATIGTLFCGNTEITSFYELKHFVGLTTIDENAFLGCSNLESVSIPENIATIGDKAFYNCNKLKGVYAYMPTPPAITETTFTNYATATLYVCRNRKTTYDNADVWKNFFLISTMIFKEGAGTEENPYLLFDPDDFKNLANDVNAGTSYEGTYFKVAKKEIDFNGVTYTAIGKSEIVSNNEVVSGFAGNFDGNDVTITNLTTNKALFGYIAKKGVVANITIDESCKINGYTMNVAGIAGSNEGTIDNCINKAPVSCTKYHVAGICGDNMGTISNCKNYGAITCESENGMTGGIAGDLDGGHILNCENYGSVVSDGFWIGGIVGLITGQITGRTCSIKNCQNQGNVTGPYDVGGIFGHNSYSVTVICDNMVSGCTIKGTSSKSDSFGAGVIGSSVSPSTCSNNFYTPNVVLIVGNQTYDGTTPRGVWNYDSSTQSYGPADVTDNCAAMILPDGNANIAFADANVKAICVANWDISGDGELSEAEAAAVTDLGKVFMDNQDITSFNELQYFTGLKAIADEAFKGCSNLASVTLPEGLESIGGNSFGGAGLTSIKFPQSLINIWGHAFQDCASLASIDFNGCSATIYENAFAGCESLTEVTVPSTCTLTQWNHFGYCNSLKSATILAQGNWLGGLLRNCPELETVVLGSTNLFGDHMFEESPKIKTITIKKLEAISRRYENVMEGNNSGCLFIIPEGTAEQFLKDGYRNLSDLSALPLVKGVYEAESARIQTMAAGIASGDKTALTSAITTANGIVNNAEDYPTVFTQIDAVNTAAKAFLATATLAENTDVTAAAIIDPNFDSSLYTWNSQDDGFWWWWNGEQSFSNGDIAIERFVEKNIWEEQDGALADGARFLTIGNLPAGRYRLECDAIATWQHDASVEVKGVSLFAGDQQTPVATENGKPQHFSVDFTLITRSDCKKVGIQVKNTNANWVAFDNVRLTYLGAKEPGTEDYMIDYADYSGFPFWVMGYVPEWYDGVMTDMGGNYTYEAIQGAEHTSDVIVKTNDGTEYYRLPSENTWHQYFIAQGIPTKVGGKYTVKAMVKASEPCSVNVNMLWGWEEGQQINAIVHIGTEWQEVEWEYYSIGGTSCDLLAQPDTKAQIEWKWLTVSQETRPLEWVEQLTNGDAERQWTSQEKNTRYDDTANNYKICAWGRENGRNLADDGFVMPFPADIVEVEDDNHAFVVHAQDCTDPGSDESAWDNQFWIQSPKSWKTGRRVKLHFRYRASQAALTNTQVHWQTPTDYLVWHAIGDIAFTTEWQEYDGTMLIEGDMDGTWSIAFNLNAEVKTAVDFYFDDLSWQVLEAEDPTDISTLADVIYADEATGAKGSTTNMTINMKNAQATSGYSFDLKLPDGVTVESRKLSNRHEEHSSTMRYHADTGVYSFAVTPSSYEISGNDGAIMTLKLKVADDVALGDYAVRIQNAKYSLPLGEEKIPLVETVSKLLIGNYIKGDVNGDGDVDIADAVCIVNHVVGKPTPKFNAMAADVNGDGDTDIADAVRIVNLVVGKISALAPRFGWSLPEPE